MQELACDVLAGFAFSGGLLFAALAGSPEEAAIRAAYEAWVKAVTSGNPYTVVTLYAEKAVLLATFSPRPLVGFVELSDYFVKFTALPRLTVETHQTLIRIYGDIAINSGLYTFSYEKDGKVVHVPARFSFTYRKDAGRWKIVDHHSSVVPSPLP